MTSEASTYKGSTKRTRAVCTGLSVTGKISQGLIQSSSAPIATNRIGNVVVEYLVTNVPKKLKEA